MANSTWRELCNEVWRLMGLKPLDTDATFNDDSLLEKPYLQVKYAVKLAHRHMGFRVVRHFATRRIPLPITSATAVYDLDTGINPSAIKYQSFFNVTQGNANAGYLENWTEREFNTLWPDVSKITSGGPTHWILLAPERTDVSPVWRVRIFPNPDASYDLQYRAQLMPYVLSQASDVILWPSDAEHALIEFAWGLGERALGEGKEGYISQLAGKAVDDVLLIYGVPDDERKAVRTMRPLGDRMRSYPYNYNKVVT